MNLTSITFNYKLKIILFLALSILFISFSTKNSHALTYNYTSYPMDDTTFQASFTMNAASIQSFLQNEGSGLASFSDVENCGPTTGANYSFYATYYSCGQTESAAQIIYDASQAYQINPQVILAMMQKEQSLITTPNPSASQLDYAMGYGCPDSSTSCSVSGFFNQVDNGTWQLRADIDLINGQSYWGYSPSAYPCDSSTNYYSAALLPGNNVTFYDDYGTAYANFVIPNSSTAALYCYTPHVFPGSAAEYYSGYYWFVYYFSIWFGSSVTPYAFMSTSSPAMYMFINGYKVSIPNTAILQDYGISPNALVILPQSQINNIPTPSLSANNISPTLSSIIAVYGQSTDYLVSVGQKYVISPSQFTNFGFSTNNISYATASFVDSINGSGNLSNFISTPSNNVFEVTNGVKNIILNPNIFYNLDPSGTTTELSDYIANSIPSGTPIANSPILLGTSSGAVFLYDEGQYYGISSINVFDCIGFSSTLNIAYYPLANDSYINPVTTSGTFSNCLVNNGSNAFLLNGNLKYPVPNNYINLSETQGLTPVMNYIVNLMPTGPILNTPALQASGSPTIYYLSGGGIKTIPSIQTYNDLGISQVAQLNPFTINGLTNEGVILVDGEIVMGSNGGAVYMISGNSRIVFKDAADFLGYKFNWNDIQTINQSQLDQSYPFNNQVVQNYIYDSANSTVYLVDQSGCYFLNANDLNNFNTSINQIIQNTQYSDAITENINLSTCGQASNVVLDTSNGTVYQISNGVLHPFPSWQSLQQFENSSTPSFMQLSYSSLNNLTIGSDE